MIRKALMGASFALENLSIFSRRLINVRPRMVSNLTLGEKDDGFSPYPVVSPEATHKRLLLDVEIIVNAPELDLRSCMHFLRKSTYFYKQNSQYLKDLYNESSFRHFCDNLCDRNVRLPSTEAAYILVGLCKLEINNMNPLIVMRYWHRHIDANIKFLSYIQIELLLIHVLGQMSNTSWTESKKLMLVHRLRTKILTEKLEVLSMPSIISALNLMHAFGIVDIRASEIFLKSLSNQNEPDWLQMFRILGKFDHLPAGYEHLLEQARKYIFDNIMDLPLSNLIAILRLISVKLWQGHPQFYDAKFVDAIVDRALWDDCGFETSNIILNALSRINHKHIPLLNYLIKKYEENLKDVNKLIALFAYAVKVNCRATARLLLEKLMHNERTIKCSRKMLTHVVYYMSVLDCYDFGLLQTFFANDDYGLNSDHYKVKRIISMVRIFCPSFPVPKFSKKESRVEEKGSLEGRDPNVISEIDSDEYDEEKVKVFPLKSKLELIFGGPAYLLTNVKIGYRFGVDHAVIFRQGGFPVAVNLNNKSDNDDIFLNKLTLPPNSHKVLITSIPSHGYVINTGEMIGPFNSFVKCLKVLKYDTIFVSQLEWNKMPDSEKIPWLMRIIRERCSHIFQDVI